MTSAGAIALAEFLPESTSLLHLDLTGNGAHGVYRNGRMGSVAQGQSQPNVGGGDTGIDLAGVMALSKGLQGNRTMRCLDLDVPPGDEAFAR